MHFRVVLRLSARPRDDRGQQNGRICRIGVGDCDRLDRVFGLSWYAVLGLAVIGTLVYFWMRSTTTIGMFQRVGAVQYTAVTYATQVLTSAILFAIGRGLGSIF